MQKEKIASILLRVGLGFAFIFVAVDGFIHPENWMGYFPSFILNTGMGESILPFFSVFEVVLGVWLLSGFKTASASLLAAIVLIGIVLSAPSQFLILFRDLSLAISALALFFLERNSTGVSQ